VCGGGNARAESLLVSASRSRRQEYREQRTFPRNSHRCCTPGISLFALQSGEIRLKLEATKARRCSRAARIRVHADNGRATSVLWLHLVDSTTENRARTGSARSMSSTCGSPSARIDDERARRRTAGSQWSRPGTRVREGGGEGSALRRFENDVNAGLRFIGSRFLMRSHITQFPTR
jgi:hypothetical protein